MHYSLIENVIEKLEFAEKNLRNHQTGFQLKDKQPLMVSMIESSLESFNGINVDGGGSGSMANSSTDSSLQYLYSNLVETSDQLLSAVFGFVNTCSESFNFPFKLKPVYSNSLKNFEDRRRENDEDDIENEKENDQGLELKIKKTKEEFYESEKIEIIQAEEKIFLYFYGLSRLTSFLNEKSIRFVN